MVLAETVLQADHVPSSGVVVLPERVSKPIEVLAGWVPFQVRLSQWAAPASKTRETKTPGVA